MNIKQFEKIKVIIEKLRSIQWGEAFEWEIDNINLQYIESGQVNIRLINKKF